MTDFLVKRFIKNSTDVNDPAVRTAYGNLAGAVGIFCNVLLCAAKLAVGTLFGVVLLAGAKRLNKFYELTNEQVKHYVASGEPMDKAGAYGIQGTGGRMLVHDISGDFYNVVGLPIARVARAIQKLS